MRDTITLSLPPKMTQQIEAACKREHRTRSELIREALRVYFGRVAALPVYTPTPAELRALQKGRAEIRRGHYFTLDEFRTWLLDRQDQEARPKKSQTRTTPRTRATP